MKWVAAITCVLLFPLGYWICLWAYPNDTVKFFDLRYNLMACLIGLSFLSGYLNTQDRRLKFIFNVGMGLSLSDIIDRFYFNCTEWQTDDYFMIFATLLLAFLDYKNLFKWLRS